MSIQFTIYGNQEDPVNGNPIPYTRTTQGSHWNARSLRYNAWKSYVVAKYLDTIEHWKEPINKADYGDAHDVLERKPIKLTRGRVSVTIFFSDERHPDPDNTVKGILDALFQSDKHIDVETTHYCKVNKLPQGIANQRPRVEVVVSLEK